MKTLFFVASLAAMLLMAIPASAQLGPAGVPGAPGLAETDPSVKQQADPARPNPPPLAQETPRKATASVCSRAKDVVQCKTRVENRRKALVACKGKRGAERKQCLKEQTAPVDCSKSRDPAQCELHQKVRELCKDTLGREHQQCLRDNLVPKK